jgi:hypothetical protein
MRTLILTAALLAAHAAATAQPAAPAAPAAAPAIAPIADRNVAAAQARLEALDGNGTVVTHADGWTTVNEPAASAQWSFTPAGHYAHPAVVRRIIVRDRGGKISVDTQTLCEAKAESCTKLVAEFEAMNDRIVQALRGRGRPTPPQ